MNKIEKIFFPNEKQYLNKNYKEKEKKEELETDFDKILEAEEKKLISNSITLDQIEEIEKSRDVFNLKR